MPTKSRYLVVVAGGSGLRMGHELPKQFIPILEYPILMHTIRAFQQSGIHETVLVLPENHIPFWEQLCIKHNFKLPLKVTKGGSERFYSVKNGLAKLPNTGLVAIHDGVRPLVSVATIERCFKLAHQKDAAVPCLAPTESLRQLTNAGSVAVNRSVFLSVQTPQVFTLRKLKEAYNQDFSSKFTDDASVFEAAGYPIFTTDGNPENIKITRPMDLKLAEAIIQVR